MSVTAGDAESMCSYTELPIGIKIDHHGECADVCYFFEVLDAEVTSAGCQPSECIEAVIPVACLSAKPSWCTQH